MHAYVCQCLKLGAAHRSAHNKRNPRVIHCHNSHLASSFLIETMAYIYLQAKQTAMSDIQLVNYILHNKYGSSNVLTKRLFALRSLTGGCPTR